MHRICSLALMVLLAVGGRARGQMTLDGRLLWPAFAGADKEIGIGPVLVFGSLPGRDRQPLAFRSWETNPVGWYRLSGPAGRYTLLFTQPGGFMRPAILDNIYTRDGRRINLSRMVGAPWDQACMDESSWDPKASGAYLQPFVARGTGITQVGFKLAHDGVDGTGPGGQDLLVSIHEVIADQPPEKWPRIGPEMPVVNVDCGGAKNYSYSAGFNSGEVPTAAGKTYAVKLAAADAGGKFQFYWHALKPGEKYLSALRANAGGEYENTGKCLWMTIASDGDGLLIPYNKRVHREFNQLTKMARVWSQTYVARGRSLAGVVIYGAASGAQPSMNRQRLKITVCKDGVGGEPVGVAKLAVGNGLYTGDASWGTYGAAYEPDEVRLEPGRTYCLQFESIETPETLGKGIFKNVKGMISDGRPGFNPYRKHPLDVYKGGRAYLNGTDPRDFSLDMQVIEYETGIAGHMNALRGPDLLKAGNFEKGRDWSAAWKSSSSKNAKIGLASEPGGGGALRLEGSGKSFDAVVVQRAAGLSPSQTYRPLARVCSNHLPSEKCRAMIGIDPTGQTENPDAPTVVWTVMPAVTGRFEDFTPDPVRPAADAISVFLRMRAEDPPGPAPFAEFNHVSLRQVDTRPPAR